MDEIELNKLPEEAKREVFVDHLFKIVGEYKNPSVQPWTTLVPNKEVKTLWEKLKKDNEITGFEEIVEGSSCFEHCFEFWGTWKVKKEGITIDYLKS